MDTTRIKALTQEILALFQHLTCTYRDVILSVRRT